MRWLGNGRRTSLVQTCSSSKSGIGIAKPTGLNVMTNVCFSKVQNMAHWRNLAAAIRSARVKFDYQFRSEPVTEKLFRDESYRGVDELKSENRGTRSVALLQHVRR